MNEDKEIYKVGEKNTKSYEESDTKSAQDQKIHKEELPENLDYNSITNFFLDELKLKRKYQTIDYIPFLFSVILAILPLINQKFFKGKITQILVVAAIILLIVPYISLFIKSNKNEQRTSELYDKLNDKQVKFLSNDKLLNDMIDYLRKGDKSIVELMYKIIGLGVTLYTAYSKINFISDNLLLLCYVGLIIGYAVWGIADMSQSNERLYFLNLLQHLKVKNIQRTT